MKDNNIFIHALGNFASNTYTLNVKLLQFIVGQQLVLIECLSLPYICSGLPNQNTVCF